MRKGDGTDERGRGQYRGQKEGFVNRMYHKTNRQKVNNERKKPIRVTWKEMESA